MKKQEYYVSYDYNTKSGVAGMGDIQITSEYDGSSPILSWEVINSFKKVIIDTNKRQHGLDITFVRITFIQKLDDNGNIKISNI